MSNKMTLTRLQVKLNNALSILPGHTIKQTDVSETPVGVIMKGGGLNGKEFQEKIAVDIVTAYNETYGKGINPEAVGDLKQMLQECIDELETHWGSMHCEDCDKDDLMKLINQAEAAIEKAKL